MCWPHVYRNVVPRLKSIKCLDKSLASEILASIEDLQWSALNRTCFLQAHDLLESKFIEKTRADDDTKHSLVKDFFGYFRKVWIESKESNWFEGANAWSSSNNQSIEGVNKEIKAAHTFRKRMPLGEFFDCMLRMVHEWSLQDASLLFSNRRQILQSKPNGLKMRTDGYTWFRQHSSNSNYVSINPRGRLTRSEELNLGKVDSIWVVPSSSSGMSSLKELAKKRMQSRLDLDSPLTFDEYLELRKSCWFIEERGGEYYCDCPCGMKGKMCKVSLSSQLY
jgi:hypothetical protein